MAESEVAICNSAMRKLGTSRISNLNDETKEARLCRGSYPICRDLVTRLHPWSCAQAIQRLTPDPVAPDFGYQRKFLLPPTCLRVLAVNEAYPVPYDIYGREIHSDATAIELRFCKKMEDPLEIDSIMGEAIAFWLAKDLCYPLLQSRDKEDDLEKEFWGIVRMAQSVNAKEKPALTVEADDWVESRFGGRRTNRSGV